MIFLLSQQVEEADWLGLTLEEAIKKQQRMEEAVEPVPLKHEFRQQLLQYLEENPNQESVGTGSKLPDNPPRYDYVATLV